MTKPDSTKADTLADAARAISDAWDEYMETDVVDPVAEAVGGLRAALAAHDQQGEPEYRQWGVFDSMTAAREAVKDLQPGRVRYERRGRRVHVLADVSPVPLDGEETTRCPGCGGPLGRDDRLHHYADCPVPATPEGGEPVKGPFWHDAQIIREEAEAELAAEGGELEDLLARLRDAAEWLPDDQRHVADLLGAAAVALRRQRDKLRSRDAYEAENIKRGERDSQYRG